MSERVEDTPVSQENEIGPRHIRVGLLGPIGSGKSTLARIMSEAWQVRPVEEDFGENPYLEEFYRSPEQYSFKSQSWFLTRKINQLASLTSESTEIIDPSLEMDFLYAKVQYEMGWMTNREWQTYQMLYNTHIEASQIREPDVFVVVNAPVDILNQRIRKRGRDFELRMLDKNPQYFERLHFAVANWQLERFDTQAIIPVDSNEFNFVNSEYHKRMVMTYVQDLLVHYIEQKMDFRASDGAFLKLPEFQ